LSDLCFFLGLFIFLLSAYGKSHHESHETVRIIERIVMKFCTGKS
jgi:hypothetical protein